MIQNWVVWAIASFLGHSTLCMQVQPYITFDKDAKHLVHSWGILATHTVDKHYNFLAELISNAI